MSQNHTLALALDALPAGKEVVITRLQGDSEGLVRAQAMGLRAGKPVEVLRRSGRLLHVRVGATNLAISADLARRVECDDRR